METILSESIKHFEYFRSPVPTDIILGCVDPFFRDVVSCHMIIKECWCHQNEQEIEFLVLTALRFNNYFFCRTSKQQHDGWVFFASSCLTSSGKIRRGSRHVVLGRATQGRGLCPSGEVPDFTGRRFSFNEGALSRRISAISHIIKAWSY